MGKAVRGPIAAAATAVYRMAGTAAHGTSHPRAKVQSAARHTSEPVGATAAPGGALPNRTAHVLSGTA